MAVAFMMDQHVSGPIVRGLRVRGVDVLTAFEDHAHELPDDELLQRATEQGRVLVSQDDDLLAIAHQWQEAGRPFAGLVYSHQLNITIGRAIEDLEVLAECSSPEEFANKVQFIPFS